MRIFFIIYIIIGIALNIWAQSKEKSIPLNTSEKIMLLVIDIVFWPVIVVKGLMGKS